MNAGKLKNRITLKRLTRVSDNYGGYNSTLADVKTLWCDLKEVSGDIKMENGMREHRIYVEMIIRKKTADDIQVGDIFIREGESAQYRINEMYQSELNYYVQLKATKID